MTYKFKKGDTGLTRGGHPYEVVSDDLNGKRYGPYSLAIIITGQDGGFVAAATDDGKQSARCFAIGMGHPDDLMPPAPTIVSEEWAPTSDDKIEGWYVTHYGAVNNAKARDFSTVIRRTTWSDGTRTYEEEPL